MTGRLHPVVVDHGFPSTGDWTGTDGPFTTAHRVARWSSRGSRPRRCCFAPLLAGPLGSS
jgi:hypothetical protein